MFEVIQYQICRYQTYVGVSYAQPCGRPQNEEQQTDGCYGDSTHTRTHTSTNKYINSHTTHTHNTQDRSFNFRSVVAIKKSKATKLHSILQKLLFLSQFPFPVRLELLYFLCCIVFSRHLCNVDAILRCPRANRIVNR